MDADEIAGLLHLQPHPEGGHYVETWRDAPEEGSRGHGSAIYFLLREGLESAWHRVDATEVWHYYAGDPVRLRFGHDVENPETRVLGNDFAAGERPQIAIPENAWQSARSLGAWSLVGCTVSPAFAFEGFELLEDPAATAGEAT
jgi:hypothetical protein